MKTQLAVYLVFSILSANLANAQATNVFENPKTKEEVHALANKIYSDVAAQLGLPSFSYVLRCSGTNEVRLYSTLKQETPSKILNGADGFSFYVDRFESSNQTQFLHGAVWDSENKPVMRKFFDDSGEDWFDHFWYFPATDVNCNLSELGLR